MRILGFSKKWPKLNNDLTFTTFRFTRKDKDWQVEEVAQIVYKQRSKDREILGIARIIRKQEKDTRKEYYRFGGIDTSPDVITPYDAKEDGFTAMHGWGDIKGLLKWLHDSAEPMRFYREPIVNKLILYWISKEV